MDETPQTSWVVWVGKFGWGTNGFSEEPLAPLIALPRLCGRLSSIRNWGK
jgi:hypothetical protein